MNHANAKDSSEAIYSYCYEKGRVISIEGDETGAPSCDGNCRRCPE